MRPGAPIRREAATGADGRLSLSAWFSGPDAHAFGLRLSECHPVTLSPYHPLTPSPPHPVTPSPRHPFTSTTSCLLRRARRWGRSG